MRRTIVIIFLTFVSYFSFGQSDNPNIRKTGASISEFLPAKWKVIAEAKGDLNNDGLADFAIVIEDTNPKNLIGNKDRMGGDTLNLNARILLIILKKSKGIYELAIKNASFIPSSNSEESPCLLDPFGENGGITIEKGLLTIQFQNFYSCGAWEIYNFDYIFRYQKQRFELIGYNKSSLHRSSGEQTTTTMNFSTFKMNYTSGANAFKDGGKLKTTWAKIKPKKMLDLGTIKENSIAIYGY